MNIFNEIERVTNEIYKRKLGKSDMTHEEIKAEALKRGYTFSDEDCAELIRESYLGEKVEDAVDDYLRAYEA
jgi:hypothetical protein